MRRIAAFRFYHLPLPFSQTGVFILVVVVVAVVVRMLCCFAQPVPHMYRFTNFLRGRDPFMAEKQNQVEHGQLDDRRLPHCTLSSSRQNQNKARSGVDAAINCDLC
jgi:hypothetical protein